MLEWIVTASLLILLVILLRRLPIAPWQRYALWLVVLARLLVPVQLYVSPVTVHALLPEEPAFVQASGGQIQPQAPAAGGSSPDLWPGLVAAVKERFPSAYPFLSNPDAAEGRLEGEVLTLWMKDDFTKNVAGTPPVLAELGRLASAQTGLAVRCVAKVGRPPAQAPAAAAPEHDRLDDLLAFGRQFDNIVTEE